LTIKIGFTNRSFKTRNMVLQLDVLLPTDDLTSEISALKKSLEDRRRIGEVPKMKIASSDFSSEKIKLLSKWARLVCALYDVKVIESFILFIKWVNGTHTVKDSTRNSCFVQS